MLLRSSSTPILNSWILYSSKESTPEPETFHPLPKTRSLSLIESSLSPFYSTSMSLHCDSNKKMTRALSETDLGYLAVPKKKPINGIMNGIFVEEEEEYDVRMGDTGFTTLFEGGEVGVGGGGRTCGGGGSSSGGNDGGDDRSSGSWDSSRGNDSTDVYYQKLIEANPGNSLLLSNYGRFLKEVHGDLVKTEEYIGRAILANPNDGSILSMYADLIWESQRDVSRAEVYFEEAVKAASNDCFVMASYARFLWEAEEDFETEEEDEGGEELCKFSPSTFIHGTPPPPFAAAS